jgi:hypothetical protein
MKGKSQKGVKANDAAPTDIYAGGNSNVVKEAKNKAEGFKKGGKTVKMMGGKSAAHAGRKPRKAGGSVMSSASKGSARPGFDGTMN